MDDNNQHSDINQGAGQSKDGFGHDDDANQQQNRDTRFDEQRQHQSNQQGDASSGRSGQGNDGSLANQADQSDDIGQGLGTRDDRDI